MSLINDALKRAQQEREKSLPRRGLLQQGQPEDTAAPAPAAPVRSGLPVLTLVFGLIIGGSALAAAVAFGVFLWVQLDDRKTPPADERSPAITETRVNLDPADPASSAPAASPSSPSLVAQSNQAAVDRATGGTSPAASTTAPAPPPKATRAATTPGKEPKTVPTEPLPAEDLTPQRTTEVAAISTRSAPTPAPNEADPDEIEALRQELEALRTELAAVKTNPAPDPSATQRAGGDQPSPIRSPSTTDPPPAPRQSETAPPPAPAAANPNPEVQDYVSRASITGIRLSGASPKVVLNNRVYRLGELVLDSNPGLLIRIVDIQRTTLTFEDEHGFRYTKRF